MTCELICDGAHVKPVWIKTIFRTKGTDGICLITDSYLAGKRITEGVHCRADGKKIFIRDGVCRDEDGALSGSACTQDRTVKIFMEIAGASLPEAMRCASLTPARVIGMEDQLGSIAEGKLADLVLLDEHLAPVLTLVDGQIAHDGRMNRKKCEGNLNRVELK